MNEPWRIAVGVVLLGALAGALFWVLSPGGSEPGATVAATTTVVLAPDTAVIATTTGPSLAPTTSAAPSTTAAESSGNPPPADIELRDVLPAAQRALTAWGEFAVTGDVSLVEGSFDPSGPQYEQLVEESVDLSAEPLGPPPYVFAMGEVELERPRPQRVILVGPVSISRPGEPVQRFQWRLHLRWSGTDWLLWTVDEVEDTP